MTQDYQVAHSNGDVRVIPNISRIKQEFGFLHFYATLNAPKSYEETFIIALRAELIVEYFPTNQLVTAIAPAPIILTKAKVARSRSK